MWCLTQAGAGPGDLAGCHQMKILGFEVRVPGVYSSQNLLPQMVAGKWPGPTLAVVPLLPLTAVWCLYLLQDGDTPTRWAVPVQ